jgi:glycosyltransferase involved in cell wall biosynthesis
MNICKIWDADYPWDIRVEKVASALAAAGHAVHLVCRNQARRERHEWNGSFMIHRLPALLSSFARAHTLLNFPYPFNPVWISNIARTILDAKADLILVRDIPLAVPAAILGKLHRIPVILDMAENYPAMLRDRLLFTPTGLPARLIRRPRFAQLVERFAIRLADHVIVVIEESRERIIHAGIHPNRVTVVCNTPMLEQWKPRNSSRDLLEPDKGTNLVYLGNLDGSRGIDVAIRAIRHLKDAGCAVGLSIVGDGPCIEQLRDLSFQLDVADRVKIMGRLPFSQVQAVMGRSHVGLIPHYATDAWNSTIPNKLFDYMLLGMPVVVSDAKPTARIVRAEGCGEVFNDRDVVDLARCILALKKPEVRRRKGIIGRAAVHKRYNWKYDSLALVKTIEAVGSRRERRHLGLQGS